MVQTRRDSSERLGIRARVGAMLLIAALGIVMVPSARADFNAADVTTFNAVGPPLTALRTKIADPNWLMMWLLKPSRLRPGTIMPDADLTPDEARSVIAYLYGAGGPVKAAVHWQGGDARIGEQLFVTRGCRGCHAILPAEQSVSNRVPNLAGIGLKVRGDWLFSWIKSPRTYNPRTAMPQLTLSDEDIRHLVAFLLSRKAGAEIVATAPPVMIKAAADAAEGRKVVARYECANCHQIQDAPPPAAAFELAADGTDDAVLRNGRLLVAYYNCRSCHSIEGQGGAVESHLERRTFAPPTLEGEGRRVQTSWLIKFLEQPTTLRPWLQIRMPNYDLSSVEATALARYFAALADVAATDEPLPVVSEDLTTSGLRRVAHFKCIQCHPTNVGLQLPEGVDPENLSINLTLAKTRLRPSWIREFLARPKAIAGTKTRMPTVFYTIDGSPKVDDPDQQIAAIAAYLLHMTESPESALARLEAAKAAQTPATDWTTVEY